MSNQLKHADLIHAWANGAKQLVNPESAVVWSSDAPR